jgi:hypothetical protein
MKQYRVRIKQQGRVLHDFICMAVDSITAAQQHACLIPTEGGYIVVSPVKAAILEVLS